MFERIREFVTSIGNGAKLNALDANGETPLHRCGRAGGAGAAAVAAAKALLVLGADPRTPNALGMIPAQVANHEVSVQMPHMYAVSQSA